VAMSVLSVLIVLECSAIIYSTADGIGSERQRLSSQGDADDRSKNLAPGPLLLSVRPFIGGMGASRWH